MLGAHVIAQSVKTPSAMLEETNWAQYVRSPWARGGIREIKNKTNLFRPALSIVIIDSHLLHLPSYYSYQC